MLGNARDAEGEQTDKAIETAAARARGLDLRRVEWLD